MKVTIGMRTIKTAVCAAVAILIAQYFHLENPTAAGIIALLSVTNTKRSSFETAFFRIASLILATLIAYVCFNLLGYHAIAFGCYLLLFIPLAVRGKMTDGIPVSSVLVTHYLVAGDLSFALVKNAFLLLFIGAGVALIANLFMPDFTKKLQKKQSLVDETIKQLLLGMSLYLGGKGDGRQCDRLLDNVVLSLKNAEIAARQQDENRLFSEESYYLDYFTMRRLQVDILKKMNQLVKETHDKENRVVVTDIEELLQLSSLSFSEHNDGLALQDAFAKVMKDYRLAALPQTREEFEQRAKLYQLISEFDHFITLKIEFHKKYQANVGKKKPE